MKHTYIQPQSFFVNVHPATILCESTPPAKAPRVNGSGVLVYTDQSGDANGAF